MSVSLRLIRPPQPAPRPVAVRPAPASGRIPPVTSLRLGVLEGDGIGPEIVPAAIAVADAALRRAGTAVEWEPLPVGLTAIRLTFDLDTDATPEQIETLVKLTKRYCVVYQTLVKSPTIEETCRRV